MCRPAGRTFRRKVYKGGFAAGKPAKGGGKHAERAARMGKISDRKFQKFFCSTFCTLQKVEKELLGRAKSCRWQVFVRRRPPKQGELRTDVSKATMWGETRAEKGFNFVSAKPPLRRAESRFGKPRCSLQRERVVTFCVVQKVTKKHAGLRPATSIQISARYMAFAEMTGVHQVTSHTGHCNLPGYRR